MNLPRLSSLDRATLWDRAYAALKDALLAGKLPPGQRLVLRQLADDLGISLTPVRDAVNRLIAERVLERGGLGPAGGAMVPLLDEDHFRQLMTVRASLEPVAAAAAAERATAADVDRVEAFLTEMKRAVQEHRPDDYLAAHYQFHFTIYRLCGMPVVEEMIESVWLRSAPALTLLLPDNVPSLKRWGLHQATVRAMRKHDADAAAAAVRADIESARDDIAAKLRQRTRGEGPSLKRS